MTNTTRPIDRTDLALAGISPAQLRRDVRGKQWQRIYRGVYAVPDVEDPELQRLRAAHVHLGPEATAVLGSALLLHGIDGRLGHHFPELAMPPGLEKHQREGVQIHFWNLQEDEVCEVLGLRTTTLARTLADCARLLPRMQAVSCLDSALDRKFISPDELPDLRAFMVRKRHCVSGRKRVLEARSGAQSPLETRVRLRAADGGFPPDALQIPIRSGSHVLLGYGDMGYELPDGSWLIVEADGVSVHDQPEALLHDRRRQNAFLNSRVSSVLRFTWDDTRHPAYIPGVIGEALSKAGWHPNPRRP